MKAFHNLWLPLWEKERNLVMGAWVGRWMRTDFVFFQHLRTLRFPLNMGFPWVNTGRSLAWPCCLQQFWALNKSALDGIEEKCLKENRTLIGCVNNGTAVAMAPTTTKRTAKPKFTKQDFIPTIVWLTLWVWSKTKVFSLDCVMA